MTRFLLSHRRRLHAFALAATLCVTPGTAFAQSPPASASAADFPTGPGSLSGLWQNAEYKFTGGFSARERALHTVEGQVPPLLPPAAAVLEKRLTDADKGNIFANTLTQCLPAGIPGQLFGAAYPVEFIETPGKVTMLFEEQNHFRQIPLGARHPDDPDPTYFGNSIGHWEGDTLVVDTIAIRDNTTLDMVGTPHSEAMHLVERYRRIAADRLEIRVTVDDPKTFNKPWEARITFKPAAPGTQIAEYICENNRNAPDANGNTTFGAPAR